VTSYAESGGAVSSYSWDGFALSKEKLMFRQWLFNHHRITRWKFKMASPPLPSRPFRRQLVAFDSATLHALYH
jgi:hypothetical protein